MNIKRIVAGISAMVMMLTSSMVGTLVSAESIASTPIITKDFEDGVADFTARENQSTIELGTGDAHGGNNYLKCTNRTKSWHGPQFLLDGVLEEGTEYTISAWVKTPWYSTITLSMQYTDVSGTAHYTNLQSVTSQGDWQEISEVKFTIPKNSTGVYLYFEDADTNVDIYLDDFVISSAPVYEIQQDIPSLKDVYSPYFKFGGALMDSELASPSTQSLVKKHYNSITFGNELKPDAVLDQNACQEMAKNGDETNPQVNIDSARNLLDFCQENDIPVRGHVLVWHSQTPDWFFKEGYSDDGDFVTKEVMLQRMENYIKNLMELLATEYPDVEFYAWDVVNEIWLDEGTPRNAGTQAENSNNSCWVKIFGDNSFVDYAFEYARKYAPEGCKLYYNDFNEYMPQKTQAIVDMVTRLKEKGIIDGIGMQSHLDVSFPSISVYEKALKAFCETGLDVQITELDVTTSDTSEAGLETQAKYYSDIMDLAVKYSDSISAVVIWGTTDATSWRSAKLPVLFNEDYTAKPCYYSIIDGLDVPSTTDEPTVTTTEINIDETIVTTTDDDVKPSTKGDLDFNNDINAVDVLILKRYILSITNTIDTYVADMDDNNDVNILDLLILKKMVLGIITQ